MGQGQGSSLLSGILGAGGGAGSMATGDSASAGLSMVQPGQQSMWDKLSTVLKDPEVMKALGKTASSLAGTIKSADEIPPQAHEVLSQMVAGAQAQQRGPQPSPEEMGVLTPQMARTVLEQMGIPGGFRPLNGSFR